MYERDNESDLDFGQARYYSSSLGRFYSVDPQNAGASVDNPQTWNAYAYVGNNPINITDPTGLGWYKDQSGVRRWSTDDKTFDTDANGNNYAEGATKDAVDDSWKSVVGDDFVYETNGGFVVLDPHSSAWIGNVTSRDDALKLRTRLYDYDLNKRAFVAGWNRNYDTNMKLLTAMVIANGIIIAAPVIADIALGGGAATLVIEAATAAPTGAAALDRLLNQAQNVSKPGSSWTQLTTKGNPQQIFDNIIQGAPRTANGAFKLADGRIVRLYESTTKGEYQGPTMQVNVAGAITKVRIQ